MKKQTAMALAAVFAMSVAGTALAAPANPFVDVPAKHWSYDSINQLVKAGVISGYGDGTYKGDRTLTRYEMATIVAKAMANSDKADAAAKKQIEALKAEFGSELTNLGVRVDNLEKNASKVKFTGEIRERYEYSDDAVAKAGDTDKSVAKTRVRLYMTAPIDKNVTFKGRLAAESETGATDSTGTADNNVKLDQAYITGEVGGVTYNFGRQPILLGQKIIINNSGNNDGLVLSAGKDVRVTAGAYKLSSTNYKIGNVDFKLNQNLHLTASYLADDKDDNSNKYKDSAVGLNYTGWKNFAVTGEYAQNSADYVKNNNDGDKAKAWAARLKYKGATSAKGSYGMWVSYRKAENNFDPNKTNWNDFTDSVSWVNGMAEMNDVKGLDFGVEYALFKNGILRVQYSDLTDEKTGDVDKKNMFAELVYTF
ncbi:S-layer homology domain-containing protein [Sporomusa acidovorans]|uniref:SLH domain-containing protein n=1 Tax=Sporomusa acidovorans (strain ATCC 49682 / DSM 3132 / Mol) TaxID=1123286 RepID=A0ABZ3J718_SPOA4|nr:S-layer homology domain-containing protein [Sporomusa acidovorans]OZC19316.1 outer membrane protein alpha precursor [Sporomusa acidovorans DSM 3132]SDD80989.1 S-layer homology domain-containing protein [Sporomusa acidovorans]